MGSLTSTARSLRGVILLETIMGGLLLGSVLMAVMAAEEALEAQQRGEFVD